MKKLLAKLKALPWWVWLLLALPAGWLLYVWFAYTAKPTQATLPASQATPGPSTTPTGTPVGNGAATNAN